MSITKTTKGIVMHNPEDNSYFFTYNDEFMEVVQDIKNATIFEDIAFMAERKAYAWFCEDMGLKPYTVEIVYTLEQML